MKMNTFKRVGLATFLSYIAIALNTAMIFFVAPFVIRSVGAGDYGVYKIIASFIGTLAVLDFGIGRTTTRFIACYDAEKDEEKVNAVYTQALKLIVCINFVIFIVSIFINPLFMRIYSDNFTTDQKLLANIMYWFAVVEVLVVVLDNGITGILGGSDHYVVINGVKIISILLKMLLTLGLLQIIKSVLVLVIIDLFCTILRLLIGYGIVRKVTKIRWIKRVRGSELLIPMLSYTGLMFLETILDQVNGNADNMIIGAVQSSEKVAVYSFGLQIYSMFWQISTAISVVVLPIITRMVVDKATNIHFENCIIKAGKIQYMLLGAIDTAFILFGKEFIFLWLGEEFMDVWIISVILIISATIPAVENVTISILRARNIMGFRVFLQFVGASFNVLLTYILVKKFDYKYAAYTTAGTTIVVSVLLMNIYYCIKLGLNMVRVLRKILLRTSITLICTAEVAWFCTRYMEISWITFIVKCLLFCSVYMVLLYTVGIGKEDKKYYFERILSGKDDDNRK